MSLEHFTFEIGINQTFRSLDGIDMRAFVGVAGLDTGSEQGMADITAGSQCCGGIRTAGAPTGKGRSRP